MKPNNRIFIFTLSSFCLWGLLSPMGACSRVANADETNKTAEKSAPVGNHVFANEIHLPDTLLPATGATQYANTIFTNPAPDCSTSMDISWITPVDMLCKIELIEKNDPHTYIFDYEKEDAQVPNDEPNPVELTANEAPSGAILNTDSICDSFDNINSKLANSRSVVEKHRFEKHGYRLSNLKPDTDYSYRILTYDKKTGKTQHSETRHFHTGGANAWKAAVIGDFHHYSPEPKRLESAMAMLNVLDSVGNGISWVLSTGDECAWGGSLNFWTELSEQPGFMNYMWAPVEGNHDSMDEDKDKTDDFFRDSHYFPHDGYPQQEGSSYWFRYGDVLFIMLNNEGMLKAGTFQPAADWMEKVIAENPSKYIVVVEHHQWLIGTDGTNGQLDRWRDLFDRLGVDLAISGHNHAYLRTYPLYDRKPVDAGKGTVYVVNSSSDNERGRALKPLAANKDLIAQRWSEGKHTVGGMLMDVNPQRIEMALYDRYGNVQDSFTVPARR